MNNQKNQSINTTLSNVQGNINPYVVGLSIVLSSYFVLFCFVFLFYFILCCGVVWCIK